MTLIFLNVIMINIKHLYEIIIVSRDVRFEQVGNNAIDCLKSHYD